MTASPPGTIAIPLAIGRVARGDFGRRHRRASPGRCSRGPVAPRTSRTPATRRGCSSLSCRCSSASCSSELADGALDAKAVAMLGVLVACGAALRAPGTGVTGFTGVFFLLDSRRPGVRTRLRVRAGRADDVRVGVAHRRRRPLVAVRDVVRGVGRILRRLPPACTRARRSSACSRLRRDRRARVRPRDGHVVLAVRHVGNPAALRRRGAR